MGILRKIHIRKRLAIGFSLLILFTGLIGFIGVISVVHIGDNMNQALNVEVKSLTYLQRIQDSFSRVRIYLRDIAMDVNVDDKMLPVSAKADEREIEDLIYLVQDEYMNMADDVINLINLLEKYPGMQAEIQQVTQIESLFEDEYRQVVNQLIQAARAGEDPIVLAAVLRQGEAVSEQLDTLIGQMYRDRLISVEQARKDGDYTKHTTQLLLTVLVVFICILSIFLSSAISNSVARPIKKLVEAAGHIGKGDFQVQIETQYKDEIGYLAQAFADMLSTVKGLVSELECLAESQEEGDLNVRLNEDNYEGDYLLVARGINKMISDLSEEIALMIGCLHEFGGGNFLADIPKFPGEKAIMNQSIDELRNRLTAVTEEINALVQHSIKGDLSKRANVSSYNGDWALIVTGLNELMESVIVPIREAGEVLWEFSQGHVNVYMQGDYRGDFETMKKSLNTTVRFISGYITEIDAVLEHIINQKDFNILIEREYLGDFSTIRKSINQIIHTFNNIILEMKNTSREISVSAQDMAIASGILSQGADNQTEAVVELNQKLKQLEEKTLENASDAQKANLLALNAKERAEAGNDSMKQMLKAMETIDHSSSNVIQVMKAMEDIATQIRLLSLNASIEAAKAGVHGKGFAVVAEQVRNLAGKSQNAVLETKNIIDDTVRSVMEGSQIAQETAEQLGILINQIHEISDLIGSIYASGQNQAADISKINNRIDQISEISEKAQRSIHFSQTLSEALEQQAEKLKTAVEGFVLQGDKEDEDSVAL